MNSSSQPGGTASLARPGAALIPTRGTARARPRHHSSGGSLSPVRSRRPPARRAGSMNTASTPRRLTSRTSAAIGGDTGRHAVHAGVRPRHAQVQRVAVHGQHAAPRGQGHQVPADAAAQVGDQSGTRIPGATMPRDHLGRRLLEPGAGEVHVQRAAELRPGAEPEFVLGQRVDDEVHRVGGPQLGAQPQAGGIVLAAQPAQEFLPFGPSRASNAGHRARGLSHGRCLRWSRSCAPASRSRLRPSQCPAGPAAYRVARFGRNITQAMLRWRLPAFYRAI